MALIFKQAETQSDLLQVHALNHRIFAEEIAQHQPHPSGLLVDRFDSSNHYFLAFRNDTVVGMISAHSGPDFSVTRRLPDIGILSAMPKPMEVRLLAIDAPDRNRAVLSGLLWQVYEFACRQSASHLLISAIASRESMYRKLGFLSLGPAVSEGAASFLPMMVDMQTFMPERDQRVRLHRRHWLRRSPAEALISLMPGPVAIHPQVAEAYATPPVSHRSSAFIDRFETMRGHLRSLMPGAHVALFPGGGTLANDVVAANLKVIFGDAPGLVLSNGEFGERLAHQAARAGLRHTHLRAGWGQPLPFEELKQALEHKPAWLWAVHLETSTGVLNDAASVLALTQMADCSVALDCVSSVGATPIPAAPNLLFASGVSGKSLGAYAGLAFVSLNEEAIDRLAGKPLCPSFDLLQMQQHRGPASTVPSSTLFALASALERNYATPAAARERFEHYCSLGRWTRQQIGKLGLKPIADPAFTAPNITTFALPSFPFVSECEKAGYQIASESCYLKRFHWGQIATMGDITADKLKPLFQALHPLEAPL